MVTKAPDYSIVAIHNHPESSVPSPSDIHALYERRNAYGVILGHDGSIYKYAIRPDDFNEAAYMSVFAKLEKDGYNKKGLGEYIQGAKSIGIDIEVL